jgi:drug/metabolite transporter (DMT)-like permease
MFATGKQKLIEGKRLPFVILTAVMQIFLSQHLFVKSQILNQPLTCAIFAMVVPAIATALAMYLAFEPSTTWKSFGWILWGLSIVGEILYNDFVDRDEELFFRKFFLIIQVLFLGIGAIMQKKMIDKNDCSLITLGFYVYFFATIWSIANYSFLFIHFNSDDDSFVDITEPYKVYISSDFFVKVLEVLGIFIALIVSESFNYIVMMYFVRKASVSKASLFGTLQAFFVLVIKLIFDDFPTQDKFFMAAVIIAYIWIFQDKYVAGRKIKNKDVKVVFKRRLSVDSQEGNIISGSAIKVSGGHFYDSQTVTTLLNPRVNFRLTSMKSQDIILPRFNIENDIPESPVKFRKGDRRNKNNFWLMRAKHRADSDIEIVGLKRSFSSNFSSRFATDLGVINETIRGRDTFNPVRISSRVYAENKGLADYKFINFSKVIEEDEKSLD